MSKLHPEVEAALVQMKARSLALNDRGSLGAQAFHTAGGQLLSDFADTILQSDSKTRQEWSDKKNALVVAAEAGDTQARMQLHEMRIDMVDNYLRSEGNFLNLFFEEVNLDDSDEPWIQNTTKNEVSVGYISEDGSPETFDAVKPQSQVRVPLKVLSTDWYAYHTRDIYKGAIGSEAQRQVDLGADLANQADLLAYNLLTDAGTTVYGSFDTSNEAVEKRTFVTHSRINTANLPSTNDLAITGVGAATKIKMEVFKLIKDYCDKFTGVVPGGIRPTGVVLVPSKDISNLADEITPSTDVKNDVAAAVLANYTNFDYMGIRWVLLPDPTLAPGYVYPVLNAPVAKVYYKRGMDRTLTEQLPGFKERQMMEKVIGFATLKPWCIRACRVKYRTA